MLAAPEHMPEVALAPGITLVCYDQMMDLASEDYVADQEFWAAKLGDHPSILALTSRSAPPSTTIHRRSDSLSADQFGRLLGRSIRDRGFCCGRASSAASLRG